MSGCVAAGLCGQEHSAEPHVWGARGWRGCCCPAVHTPPLALLHRLRLNPGFGVGFANASVPIYLSEMVGGWVGRCGPGGAGHRRGWCPAAGCGVLAGARRAGGAWHAGARSLRPPLHWLPTRCTHSSMIVASPRPRRRPSTRAAPSTSSSSWPPPPACWPPSWSTTGCATTAGAGA